MHELDAAILKWRQTLAEQIGADASVLDELESHLREEIDRLARQGQTPADALAAAIAKIGAPEALAAEFAKSEGWLPIPFVLAGAGLLLVTMLWVLATLGIEEEGMPPSGLLYAQVVALLVGCVLSIAIGALADCYSLRRAWREMSFAQSRAWARAHTWLALAALLFTLAGFLLCGVWTSSTRGEFWSWDRGENACLIVIVWQVALLLTVWKLPDSRRMQMVMGILGNVAVAFAWYGGAQTWGFVLVTLTQMPILAVGLAPTGWLRPRLGTA